MKRWGSSITVVALLFVWVGSSAALTDGEKCEAAKLKIAGKYSFCRFKAKAKAVKTGAPADFSACDTKFGLKWDVAESNGGGMCPTNDDVATIQEQIITGGDSIETSLTGTRFTDNGDGTISDSQTGLMWEQKTDNGLSTVQCLQPACPAGFQFFGSYTTTVPTSGSFTLTVSADGKTWTGTATDSIFGAISNFSGTVQNGQIDGAGSVGTTGIGIMAGVDCASSTVAGQIYSYSPIPFDGSLSGNSGSHSCPNARNVHNQYTWSATGIPPTGTTFVNFLSVLNGLSTANASPIGSCFAGHCDWRLPTTAELQTILATPCTSNPCIDPIYGPTKSAPYWTATTYGPDPYQAEWVSFEDGSVSHDFKTYTSNVRAVRGGN